MKTITFKSTPDNFVKEYLGLKSNTIRKFDDYTDVRFDLIVKFMANEFSQLNITIVNTKTNEEFTRQVTDITKFDNYYIISWR